MKILINKLIKITLLWNTWASVLNWVKAADCKFVTFRNIGGSSPPLPKLFKYKKGGVMKIIYNSDLLKKITLGIKWVSGITLYPFVILKKEYENDEKLINHEKIHVVQQKELLIVFFMIWYAIEYIIRLLIYKESQKAYENICFEKEAYSNDSDSNYLQKRKRFNFVKYL